MPGHKIMGIFLNHKVNIVNDFAKKAYFTETQKSRQHVYNIYLSRKNMEYQNQ